MPRRASTRSPSRGSRSSTRAGGCMCRRRRPSEPRTGRPLPPSPSPSGRAGAARDGVPEPDRPTSRPTSGSDRRARSRRKRSWPAGASCPQRQRPADADADGARDVAELLVDGAHRVIAALGPGVDLADAALRSPGEHHPLQRRGETAAAPVATNRRQAVLGAIQAILVADQPGHADDLVAGERDEGALGPADPFALPVFERDVERRVEREVPERLEGDLVVDALEQLGPVRNGREAEAVRRLRPWLGADRSHLLDLAVDLLEAEPLREPERTVVVDVRARALEPELLDVCAELAQEHRPDAPPPRGR